MNIVCLGYLLRGSRAWPEGIFDLIREPVAQGCQIEIGQPPESTKQTVLLGDFDIETFRKLAGFSEENQQQIWQKTFFKLPIAALDYLRQHLPNNSLILCFEIAPWLESALNEWSVPFLDIRVSPLRFGRDLYIAMRSNDPNLQKRITEHQVLDEELRLEASYLAANVNMHRQRLIETKRDIPSLEKTIVFIGQAPFDASLIGSDGHAITFKDYPDEIRSLIQGRTLLHKPHPFATEYAQEERQALETITGQPVHHCVLNAYQILASKEDVALIGLSSGMLQEAQWFNKQAHLLHQPFTPISSAEDDGASYKQVHFQRWLSPRFWHALLTPEKPAPRVLEVTPLAHQHARETFDHWWDYLKVMTWEKSHAHESFERSGGTMLRHRVEELEQGNAHNHRIVIDSPPGNDITWPTSANIRGKIRIVGTGNIVRFGEHVNFDATLEITGDNNLVELDAHSRLAGKLYVLGNDNVMSIGAYSTLARVFLKCYENCRLIIGKDCMFSFDIEARTSDGHSIVDPHSGARLNTAEDIEIGDHVWVGKGVTLLKGTYIASDSIIGAEALVSTRFEESQSVIAGIPARVIKRGVTWHREREPNFTQDELKAWVKLPSETSIQHAQIPSPTNSDPSQSWENFKTNLLGKFHSHPQMFGRGELYQGHETWGIAGQRPTLKRLHHYGFVDWLNPTSHVLDIGCNTGMFGLALSPTIAHYHGFDSNPVLIEIAKMIANEKTIENCRFDCQTFDEFMMQNQGTTFDMVLSFAVHVWIDKPMQEYAKLLYSLLKPHGILVIESNNLESNDKLFFPNMHIFVEQGFELLKQGMLKDDGIIERGFCIFKKASVTKPS